jgi:hypothetical protein
VVELGGVLDPARRLIVISTNRGERIERQNALDDRIRLGAVTHEVAEDQQPIPGRLRRGAQHRIERVHVGVDVGENQVAQAVKCSPGS